MSSVERPGARARTVRTWRDGVPVPSDDRVWSLTSGELLGCGFRVQVPDVLDRDAALTFAREQVRRIADLLGARVDDVPWLELASGGDDGGDGPVQLEGGWEPVFRGPPGTATTRACSGTGRRPDGAAPWDVLPWPVAEGSELDALPLHSTHEARVARGHLDAHHGGPVREGLWLRGDGSAARSTAGNLLVGLEGAWWHPDPGPGRVPTWLAETLAAAMAALPRRASATELAEVVDAGGVVVAVDGWGTLTRLRPASSSASPHRSGDDAWARLVAARDALLVRG